MPEPEKPVFNPFTAAKAAVNSAVRHAGIESGQQGNKTGNGSDAGNAIGSKAAKPERPVLTAQLRGISAVGTHDRLPRLSLRRAATVSAVFHLVGPFVLGLLVIIGLLVCSWLLHLNFWDFFKPKVPQDMTFTLVDDTHAKRPEKPLFNGNLNQEAGGKQQQKQPLNPAKDKAGSAKAASAPPPKPKPNPEPPKQAPEPKLAQKLVPEVPKPQAQTKAPEKQAPKPTEPPTIGKPVKAQEPEPKKTETPKPKAQAAKAATAASASAPIQVSTRTTDFGISTSPPGSASAANPQDGKAKDAGVDVAQDVVYGPFMADLEKRIKRNWLPPRGMESRKVVLLFYIRHDGQVVKVDVQKSSGDSEADRSAIEAVRVSAPFMALPPQIKEDILPVEFTFDYNVLNPKNAKNALKW